MKRKTLKTLKLNKKSISNLNASSIKGGTLISIVNPIICAQTEGTCINTHCEDGIVCDLQDPKPKQ
ncbi:hypothetical protein U8527_13375 [Kordia algicida OT-1]|uniref:Uncharacterized protein n=1 Tax=Kordia algicida OT-1 TaxID=391587 RepID=A9E5N7_9FLAO|nr:hypothetical protein [Kordia algicida]EDP95203.1 hypothetical protein KAOT1_06957 [Kordia algicida OT-1]